jgi:hypothetical protein
VCLFPALKISAEHRLTETSKARASPLTNKSFPNRSARLQNWTQHGGATIKAASGAEAPLLNPTFRPG